MTRKKKASFSVVVMMGCIVLWSCAGMMSEAVQSHYKNNMWQVQFLEKNSSYEDSKAFSVKDSEKLHIEVELEHGNLDIIVQGRKSKKIYCMKDDIQSDAFTISIDENVEVHVSGDGLIGGFLIKTKR